MAVVALALLPEVLFPAAASATAGVTWTAQTSGTTNNLNGVAYGGGQFVAVGGSGRVITASGNADLGGLSLSGGVLTPAFTASNQNYTVNVSDAVTSLDVTATVADSTYGTMTVNGTVCGVPVTVNLNPGANTITIQVYAQAGTVKPYVITVNRGAATDAEAVAADKAALTDAAIRGANPDLSNVTASLTLPAAGANGTCANTVVTLPVNTGSDVVAAELNGQLAKNMAQKQAVLEIKTEAATYVLPARQIQIDDVSR